MTVFHAVVGAIGGVAAVAVLLAMVNRRERERPTPVMPSRPRRSGQVFNWQYVVDSDPRDALAGLGFRQAAEEDGATRFEGGSQLRTRMLGGWFVKPRVLPTTVLVVPNGPSGRRTLIVRDRIRIGVRDPALEARYGLRADEIRRAVGGVVEQR